MKEETKEKLLIVAQKHFALYNYGTVSLKQVATETGIAKSTLFHHFQSKDDLYTAVIENIFKQLKDFLRNEEFFTAENSKERVLRFFKSFLSWLEDNHERSKIMIRIQLDNPERSKKLSKKYWAPVLRFIDLNVKELSQHEAKNSKMYILEVLNSMIHFVFSLDTHLFLFKDKNRKQALQSYEDNVLESIEHMLFAQ